MQFDFIGESRSCAQKLEIYEYWTKGLFGWSLKKHKLSIPIEDILKVCERE